MRVIHTTPRNLNIVGIDDHELTGLNVVTAATLLDTQKGPIIGVLTELQPKRALSNSYPNG